MVSIAFYNWSLSLVLQYVDLFAAALGVNPALLGLFNGIGQFLASIASLLFGWFADFYGVKKSLIVALILSIGAFGLYYLAVYWWMILVSIVIFGIARFTIVPFADMIFVGTTEMRCRAKAIGFARTFWAILNSFAPIVAASIVATFGGINVEGIRPLFAVSLFLNIPALVMVALLLRFHMPWLKKKNTAEQRLDNARSKLRGFVRDFKEMLDDKRLRRWLIINAVRRVSITLSIPFIPLWMVNVKGADPNILGKLGFLGIISWAMLATLAGMLADRIGRKKTFLLLDPFLYIGTFLLILAPKPEYLLLVGLLGAFGLHVGTEGTGIGGVGFLPLMVLSWEIVPEEKRGKWHGITSLTSILNLFSSALAGLMWQQGLMIQLLILPVILEVCFMMPLLIKTPEPEQP
jgi:MFS family permease